MSKTIVKNLPAGTPVRIKDSVDCNPIFKKGGVLVHQDESQIGDSLKERTYGIKVQGGVCYYFKNDDYQVLVKRDFQPCSDCDGHDACYDFGCAIEQGIIEPGIS